MDISESVTRSAFTWRDEDVYAAYSTFIRPFNTHRHYVYANERIMIQKRSESVLDATSVDEEK